MAGTLDDGVLSAVINSNFKILAESATHGLVGHQTRLQILAEKSLAKSLEMMDTTSVSEGLGEAAAQRGDLAKVVADLAAAVSSMQVSTKGAQTTPPVTP